MAGVRIQVRRDTAANWTTANPTLTEGEIGYETDTGLVKVGDGASAWASLRYSFMSFDKALGSSGAASSLPPIPARPMRARTLRMVIGLQLCR
jgi:hypothetical protein